MISVVVIDDEKKARESIVNILELSGENIRVTGEADNVETGYKVINKHKPDLVSGYNPMR